MLKLLARYCNFWQSHMRAHSLNRVTHKGLKDYFVDRPMGHNRLILREATAISRKS